MKISVFTVAFERLQKGSVLLRISQMSPFFGVRTLQNMLHLINILQRNFHKSIVTVQLNQIALFSSHLIRSIPLRLEMNCGRSTRNTKATSAQGCLDPVEG